MEKPNINTELQALIPPLTTDEYNGLEQNLIQNGCLDPLKVWQNCIVDGHNRYTICQKYGIAFETAELQFDDIGDVKIWIIRNQFDRRNLNAYQRGVLALKMENIFKEKGRENKVEKGRESALKQHGRVLQNSAKPIKTIDTRQEIANIAGVSHDTIAKVKKIEQVATPEIKAQVGCGEISIHEAYKQVRRKEQATKQEQKRQLNLTTVNISQFSIKKLSDLTQQFSTIVLDPPWSWDDEGDVSQFGRGRPEYATMTIDQILAIPVERLAEKNAHIYLWITNRSLPKGFMLLDKWGFRYVTCLTWCKPSFGMGNYFRGSSEHILFGVKGSLGLQRHDVGTWFEAERPGRHSEKPPEAYQLIESCSPPNYLELFAREPRKNWVTWGGEL